MSICKESWSVLDNSTTLPSVEFGCVQMKQKGLSSGFHIGGQVFCCVLGKLPYYLLVHLSSCTSLGGVLNS